MAERPGRAVRLFLWAWVLLGFAAYLHQFLRLAEPLARLLGRLV